LDKIKDSRLASALGIRATGPRVFTPRPSAIGAALEKRAVFISRVCTSITPVPITTRLRLVTTLLDDDVGEVNRVSSARSGASSITI
jgi:hypothetical protein